MVIADRATVRKKAGNRSPDILPDADIDGAIKASDAIVSSALNKFDWSITDPGFDAVKEVSELFAAANLLKRYQDSQDKAKEELETAKYYLGILKDNFSSATGNEDQGNIINIVTPAFRTFPKNPNAVYRRPFGGGEASEALNAFTTRTGDVI